MTAESERQVLEHLRAILADIDDIKDRIGRVEVNISALGQQVGALTTAVYSGKAELAEPHIKVIPE